MTQTAATEQVLTTEAGTFETLRAEWDALVPHAATPFPFQTAAWGAAWHGVLAPDAEPLLVAVRDEAGALVGVAPLAIVQTDDLGRAVRFLGGTEVTDYLDLVARADDMPRVWAAVIAHLRDCADRWETLDFHCLPDGSPSRAALRHLLAGDGAREAPAEVCPQVGLGGSFTAYLRALPKKERHEIRRKERNLAQGLPHARFHVVTERAAAFALLSDFFRLHRLSAPDKERFLTPSMEEFFACIVGATASAGTLRLFVLADGDTPIAMILAFLAGGRLLVYNSGFDPAYREVSAGMVLTGMMIAHAATEGATICDFLRGNESYKYRFGAVDVPVWRIAAGVDRAAIDAALATMAAHLATPADARDGAGAAPEDMA